MAKRRGEQKLVVKKKKSGREAAISPGKWFGIIITALLVGVIAIMLWGWMKSSLLGQ